MAEHRDRSSSTPEAKRAIDNLNPEELAELREAFRVFDQDGDVRERILLSCSHFTMCCREALLWQVIRFL